MASIPVSLQPHPLKPIIDKGARFQKSRVVGGRKIEIAGVDQEVQVDSMKLVTVFMNLIGNALKYSDGPILVTARAHEDRVLAGILDQGIQGRGISLEQAAQLFVPFGRLDTHAEVEGTGLGLLSVRKIVEAHGGEVFIEGHIDGNLASASFTTARGSYPSLLSDGFVTGFVAVCPTSRC